MGYFEPKEKPHCANSTAITSLKTTEVLSIMHKNKRSAQPAREVTRYDFVRPADPIGAAPKAFQKRLAAEWRKVLAQHEVKADE
ncbi:hypothetical protein [Hafnia psychrotolerans]|uniref:Uncharacterized protein n=1 Tax=Hafnia psychrotolerans TaxID=1477018 RepID=A0ABQ1G7S9_9GAMM|nr:hypothetical protein [Hafnia psychrotolerans]GGA38426.1 hypothetical protein GCM10011328_11580 [Hafnia psychrotolerans]